jgi:hypothetical protein
MRSETPKAPLTLLFHNKKGCHNVRNLPETPISTQAVLSAPSVRLGLWFASYQLQRAPTLLECRGIPTECAASRPTEQRCTSTRSARSHPMECRGTPTGDARNLHDRWSPLLAKEGISRA